MAAETEAALAERIHWDDYIASYHAHLRGEKRKSLRKLTRMSKGIAMQSKLMDLEGVKGIKQNLNSEHQHDVQQQLRGVSRRTDQARSRGASAWMQRSKGQVQKMDAAQDAAIVHQALREFGLAS